MRVIGIEYLESVGVILDNIYMVGRGMKCKMIWVVIFFIFQISYSWQNKVNMMYIRLFGAMKDILIRNIVWVFQYFDIINKILVLCFHNDLSCVFSRYNYDTKIILGQYMFLNQRIIGQYIKQLTSLTCNDDTNCVNQSKSLFSIRSK